jgi:DNA-binding response OmpR family regulator
MTWRVLIVEDDPLITRMVRDNLVFEGFQVDCVSRGDDALSRIRSFAPDLILLDLMLPKLDGFEICSAVSQSPARIPIIVISARNQVADKIRALTIGADDYITKPFTLDELLARVHALLRRTHTSPEHLDLGPVHINFSALQATRGTKTLDLTPREFEVLKLLCTCRDKVVTREQLLRSIWGYTEVPLTRSVDQFIARLRLKIEPDPRNPRYLHTVYGEGYQLTPDGE